MAIDTAQKRRAAVQVRRLPWFRRFLPAPDSTVSAADRAQLAFVYSADGTAPTPWEPVVVNGGTAYIFVRSARTAYIFKSSLDSAYIMVESANVSKIHTYE